MHIVLRSGLLVASLFGWCFVSGATFAADYVTPAAGAKVVEDQTFNGVGLLVDGKQFNGLIVRRCTFRDAPANAIYVKNAKSVVIQDCTIDGTGQNGILAGYNGNSDRLTIERCAISNCLWSGLGSNVGATNAIIRQNHIWNVGLDTVKDPTGHGMYWTATNVLIEGNEVHDAAGKDSVGISVRSSGIVRKNVVYDCNGRDGIAYYSNYPGRLGTLLIENNFVYGCRRGISAEGYNVWNNVSSINIRFNTIALEAQPLCIYLGVNLQYVTKYVYGNLLVNYGGTGPYVNSASAASISTNFGTPTDPGFVDYFTGDLHLLPTSPVRNGITSVSNYPTDDIDSQPRGSLPVSYGADE